MPNKIQPSFAKGELSPELIGRTDTTSYDIGLATASNALVHSYGGVSRRPGTSFIGPCKDHTYSPRLIPFQFKTTDQYILEFGDQTIRFIRNNALVLESAASGGSGSVTNITKGGSDLTVTLNIVHGWSNDEMVYIEDVGGMLELNGGYYLLNTAMSNTFKPATPVTDTLVDGTSFGAYTSGGTVSRVYTLTSPYDKDDIFDIKYVQNADTMFLVHKDYPVYKLVRTDHDDWTISEVTFEPATEYPESVATTVNTSGSDTVYYAVTATNAETNEESLTGVGPATADITAMTNASPIEVTTTGAHGLSNLETVYITNTGGMTEAQNRRYKVNNVASNTFELFDFDLNEIDGTDYGTFSGTGSWYRTYSKITNSSSTRDNTVTWDASKNATKYTIYALVDNTGGSVPNSGLFGFIGETKFLSFTDNNIAPDTSEAPPIERNPFFDSAFGNGANPGAVGFFEQRQVFGGSTDKPDTSQFSQIGSITNFARSSPVRDSDAITATLTSDQVNEIRHFVPLKELIVLTSGSEWVVTAGSDNNFTPDTIRQFRSSNWGSCNIRPIVLGHTVLFVTENESGVRSLGYSFQTDNYLSNDITIFSNHLTKNYTIIDWCYTSNPESKIYATRSDGTVLVLAYEQEQEVVAWSTLTTDGNIKSTSSLKNIGSNGEDAVYFVVERTIDGNTSYYLEYMVQKDESAIEDCYFVDSGLSYDGSPATQFYGLQHLIGRDDVVVLADGVPSDSYTIGVDGKLTLASSASKVHAGLGYTTQIKTLPLTFPSGNIEAYKKGVNTVLLNMYRSSEVYVGPDSTHLTIIPDTDGSLFTGKSKQRVNQRFGILGQILMSVSDPVPFTLLSIDKQFEAGEF